MAETVSSWFQSDPPENKTWHTDDRYLSQKEKAIFFRSAGLLSRSEFGARWHNTGLGDKDRVSTFPAKI